MALKLCTLLKVLSYVAMNCFSNDLMLRRSSLSELEVYPETYPNITSVSYAS